MTNNTARGCQPTPAIPSAQAARYDTSPWEYGFAAVRRTTASESRPGVTTSCPNQARHGPIGGPSQMGHAGRGTAKLLESHLAYTLCIPRVWAGRNSNSLRDGVCQEAKEGARYGQAPRRGRGRRFRLQSRLVAWIFFFVPQELCVHPTPRETRYSIPRTRTRGQSMPDLVARRMGGGHRCGLASTECRGG